MARERRATEYGKAVAHAEHEASYFTAPPGYATPKTYLAELERRTSELALAWRDMTDEEKADMKASAIRNARTFVREKFKRPVMNSGSIREFGSERSRQLDALYRVMTPEQREEYDHK